ncbi:MAG: DUF1952 domain-containing protein [Dehalococcoidia bacterium]
MKVQFYATFRQVAGGKQAEVALPAGASARDLLVAVTERYPAFAPMFWEADGRLSDYVKVFVDGREIRHLQLLDTPVPEGHGRYLPPGRGRMTSLEVRNLDPDILRAALVAELGGVHKADGSVRSAGWRVRFVTLPDARVGRLTVPAVRIDVEGAAAEAITRYLRRQSVRGGG